MINIVEIFRIVIKNMIEKRKRVFLTISGIIIGIFTFTFFVLASQGMSNAIKEQFGAFGLNVLGVSPIDAPGNGPPSGEGLTQSDISKIKQVVSDFKYVAPGIFHSAQFEYGREKDNLLALAYSEESLDDVFEDLDFKMESGRNIRKGDSGVIVLGAKAAREFGQDNIIKVGNSLKVDDKSFRVVGILEEKGDLFVDTSVIMSFDDIKEISGQETFSVIRISFFDGVDLDEMEAAIDRKLNPRNGEKVVKISSPKQAIEQFDQILGVLTMIISFVSSVALIVGGINVMNTMYSNVLERINEISVMKAIGATNSDIRNIFLIESSILGFLGAFIGFILAFSLAKILSILIIKFAKFNVPVYFEFSFFLQVILIAAFFAMLFGTYPAIRAARINPSDNLRDD